MNEQERVLTQLPLRTWGWREGVARSQAGGREPDTEAGGQARGAGHRDRAESMERRAARAFLALLWGCALLAAAAQGKEGECARGGRLPDPAQPRDAGSVRPRCLPEPRAPGPPRNLEGDLVPSRSLRTGVRRARGLSRGVNRDHHPPHSNNAGLQGLRRLKGFGSGAQGSEAGGGDAAPATRLQPGRQL